MRLRGWHRRDRWPQNSIELRVIHLIKSFKDLRKSPIQPPRRNHKKDSTLSARSLEMTINAPIDNLPSHSLREATAMHSWAVVIAQTLEHAGVDSEH